MTESDWKAFRKMVPDLRERYLQSKTREIAALLTSSGETATERFWDSHEKIIEEARVLKQCLNGHSRSRMTDYMRLMLSAGLMSVDDLSFFSDELQERAKDWVIGKK